MLKTFRIFIALFGAVCCLIALGHIIIGLPPFLAGVRSLPQRTARNVSTPRYS